MFENIFRCDSISSNIAVQSVTANAKASNRNNEDIEVNAVMEVMGD